nr:MAG TPA: hypothetical protein [Caudoviricetes sp.]
MPTEGALLGGRLFYYPKLSMFSFALRWSLASCSCSDFPNN